MKIAILVLMFAFVAAHAAGNAHASAMSESRTTTGVGDESINRSLAEEFVKCASFNDVAAACARKGTRENREKTAAGHEDLAKRFHKGGHIIAGQEFTNQRRKFHDAAMRRNAGATCEEFPKLEQQHLKRCEDSLKRLPRQLRQP
ncbi:MAG: hypothetical protein LBH94_00085 [Deltaproteobacteria bacterium]|jgi:uncharacterized protein YycO|nr:hypothetical protein [Deltaproteobacteria bacterium]